MKKLDFYGWYVTNIKPLLSVVSAELIKVRCEYGGLGRDFDTLTKREQKNTEECEAIFSNLAENKECVKYVQDIIKDFKVKKLPKNIAEKEIINAIPRTRIQSPKVRDDIAKNKKIAFTGKEDEDEEESFSGTEPHDSDEESENTNYERKQREKIRKLKKFGKLEGVTTDELKQIPKHQQRLKKKPKKNQEDEPVISK